MTTPDRPNAEEVARRHAMKVAKILTDAQKRLLFALDPIQHRDWKALSVNVNTRNKLASLDLAHFDDSGPVHCYFMRRLSPLGIEVRAIIERSQRG